MCTCMSKRSFIMSATAAMLYPTFSKAQNTDAIRALSGKLNLDAFKSNNAARISTNQKKTVFVIGEDAFLSNEKFEAEIEFDNDGVLKKLKVLSGQALAALKPINRRSTELLLPNSTASVRGTGFFIDVDVSKPHDYICCCYGEIQFNNSTSGEKQHLKNSYHSATAINERGDLVSPKFNFPYGHYDDESVLLENSVGRKPHWQLPDNKMQFLSPTPLPAI